MLFRCISILWISAQGRENIIIGIEGGLGSGKTLLMTRYLYSDQQKGLQVMANYGLNFPHEKLDVLSLMQSEIDLHGVSIGIDEATVFLDCRRSSSKMNRLLSYWVLQTRKRDVTLYFCTQDFGMIDFRLMNHTHIRILADPVYDKDGNEIENVRQYRSFDMRNPRRPKVKQFIMNIEPYFGLYDTNEIILPPF